MKVTPAFRAYFRWQGRVVYEEINLSVLCPPLTYDIESLSVALLRYTQHHTRLCMLVAEAEFFVKEARFKELCTYEELYEQYKGGKQTETQIKSLINNDPLMREAYRNRMNKVDRYNNVKAALSALQERGKVINALCANLRTEINAGYKEPR